MLRVAGGGALPHQGMRAAREKCGSHPVSRRETRPAASPLTSKRTLRHDPDTAHPSISGPNPKYTMILARRGKLGQMDLCEKLRNPTTVIKTA